MKIKWAGEKVVVVGCGGTGGWVAEGLCRVLPGKCLLILADHDTVEERNLGRQNFYPEDLGKFKSEALAERLCRRYSREIGYKVVPYSHGLCTGALVIGCVDNAAARRELAKSTYCLDGMANGGWWLDSGNGLDSGQVLIGNSRTAKFKNGCTELPLPTIQLPSLLAPAPGPSCGGQGPVINQAMAALVLQFVHLLITGELEWMGAYLDLKAGTLSTVHAEPKTAARLLGVKENSLK